jgi:hypothetical protein
MFIYWLSNLGMGGGSSVFIPPLDIDVDPRAAQIPELEMTDPFDIDPRAAQLFL